MVRCLIRKDNVSLILKLKESTGLLETADRSRYPEWFRVEVVAALNSGAKLHEVSKATKVTGITLRKWWTASKAETKKSGFRELHVVPLPGEIGRKDSRNDHSTEDDKVVLHLPGGMRLFFGSQATPEVVGETVAAVARRFS